MINFYKADETNFDHNGLGVLDRDIQNPDIEEKMNDIFTFSFNYPIFATNGNRLAARMIVKVDDPENKGQLFRILKLSKSNGMLTAFCYHIFYDLNGNEIPDTNIVGQNGQNAITQALSKTSVGHKFIGFSDIQETANIRVVRMSPVSFLLDNQTDNNFVNRFGGEIKRVNYRVWMNKIRGSDNGVTIRWKKSLDSYNATWDYTTMVTRIRPVGYNGIMLPEAYVDSPNINKIETIIIKEIQYSDIKAIDPAATSNDETAVPLEEAYKLLRTAAAKEFSVNKLDEPTVSLSVNMMTLRNMEEYKDVQTLETINPWDTVTIINERDGLSVKVRLNHYHYNPLSHKFLSMDLGNAQSSFTDIGSKVDHATNLANEANENANTAANSANGKNSNYYGPNEPSSPVDGDLWYKKNGDKTELWQYDGKSIPPGWVLLVDDSTGEEVKEAVKEAQKEAEEAKKQAQDAYDKSIKAIEDAGFSKDQAKQALDAALQSGADAIQAGKDAVEALNNAKNALKNINDLDQTVKTEITNINDELSQKVSQDTYDGLAGTVKNQSTLISQNKNEIALKADTSIVNTIKGTVDKNTAAILVNTNGIKLKADQSTVNTLTGRVTTAEGQLIVQAGQISQTVSKTELEGKGFATQTWTQGQIKTTADNINLSVSKVKTSVDNLGSLNHAVVSRFSPGFLNGSETLTLLTRNKEYTTDYIPVGKNTHIVMTYFYKKANPSKRTAYQFFNKDKKVLGGRPSQDALVTADGKLLWNIDIPKDVVYVRMSACWLDGDIGKDKLKIEFGTTQTAWSLAPEDGASQADFAAIEIKVNGIQTTVSDKADKSQVTQSASQITSIVSSMSNPNLVANSGLPINTDGWTVGGVGASFGVQKHEIYPRGNVFYLWNANTTGVSARSARFKLANGKKYTFSIIGFSMANVKAVNIYILGRKNGVTTDYATSIQVLKNATLAPNKQDYRNATFVANDMDEAYVRIDHSGSTNGKISSLYFTEIKVEPGEIATPWEQDASQSQITQIKDDLNFRVQKGDVINQINISPESILIAGQKVHITGQTSIDNAVIKDAMIADIKADKITAGTLNAANVNVINLNANNITTGTIKGANLSLNLNTGEVVFKKGAIRSTNGNLNIDISQGTMAVTDQYKSGFYFEDGKLVLNNGWLNGIRSPPKYGSLEYNTNIFTVSGLAIKGTEGVTIGTQGYNPLALFSSVNESGIAIDKKHLEIGSVGPTIISSGNTFFMNLLTKSPFIAVGTTADGSYRTTSHPGSRISLYAEYVHIKSAYSKTASGSANVIVSQDGALVRSTSASKYKTDIIRANATDYGDKLLNLPTATWTDIAETKRYRDDPVNQVKPTRNFGMIAEDLADAGLEMLVVRGADGELEGINYDRIGPALIPVIAQLKNKIEELTHKMEETS